MRSILFIPILPDNYLGNFSYYLRKEGVQKGEKFIDIKKIVKINEKKWLDDLDFWHISLSNKASEKSWLWWLMPSSRITTLGYPYDLNPLFFSLGAIEFLSFSDDLEMAFVGYPDEAIEYIKEWNQNQPKQLRFSISDKMSSSNFFKVKFFKVKPILNAIKNLFFMGLESSFTNSRINQTQPKLLVFSIMLNPETFKKSGDHFFGDFMEKDFLRFDLDIDWMYLNADLHTLYFDKNKNNHNGGRKFSNLEWLTFVDLFRIVKELVIGKIKLRFKNDLPEPYIGKINTKKFSKNFLNSNSVYYPVIELAIYFSMKNYLKCKKPSAVIFPFEQKGLENGILFACNQQVNPIKTIAFAHANYNHGHRYMFNIRRYNKILPDILATTGPSASKWIINYSGWDLDNLICLGSPRYRNEKKTSTPLKVKIPLRVVLLVGLGFELQNFADWVEQEPMLLHNCQLMVRRYPYAWMESQEQALKKIDSLGIRLSPNIGTLQEEIEWSEVCLFCSTSAGIEAMLSKKLAIYLKLDDFFSLNPLTGKPGSDQILSCTTPYQLKNLFNQIINQPIENKLKTLEFQYCFASGIYSPLDSEEIIKILS